MSASNLFNIFKPSIAKYESKNKRFFNSLNVFSKQIHQMVAGI